MRYLKKLAAFCLTDAPVGCWWASACAVHTASRDAGKSAKCRCGAGAIAPDAMQCLLELAFCYEVPQVPQISKNFSHFCGTFGTRQYSPSSSCTSIVVEIIVAAL